MVGIFFDPIRHEYTLIRPIVDPETNLLFYNYCPLTHRKKPRRKTEF